MVDHRRERCRDRDRGAVLAVTATGSRRGRSRRRCSSSNTARSATAISGAIESTFSFAEPASPRGSASCSSRSPRVIGASSRFCTALPREHRVGRGRVDRTGPLLPRARAPPSTMVPAVSIMSSTRMQGRPSTSPTTAISSILCASLRDRRLYRNARSACRYSRSRSAVLIRPASGETTTRSSPCRPSSFLQVAREHRQRRQVVERGVEVPLDLPRVQVDRDDAVRPRGAQQVGDELRADRLPREHLLVLPRVAVVRDHRGDALRRRPLHRVDHDQLLHDRLVDRLGCVWITNTSAPRTDSSERTVDLARGEPPDLARRERDPQVLRDLLGRARDAIVPENSIIRFLVTISTLSAPPCPSPALGVPPPRSPSPPRVPPLAVPPDDPLLARVRPRAHPPARPS